MPHVLVLVLLAPLVLGACREAPGPPKGIVLVLADDLGWNDVGYHGSDIRTPELDRLAASGVVLDRFYAMPICTPARAALFTGRDPADVGLVCNLRPWDDRGLAPGTPTLPGKLRELGYQTALVGKWHLGRAPEQHPNAHGFDHFYGHLGSFIDYYEHTRQGELDWQRNGEPVAEAGYSTRLIAAEAVRWLEARDRARPFFLTVSFNAPHVPVHLAPDRTPVDVRGGELRGSYASMVEELDAGIGRVLACLSSEGLERDTLVLFASDNGGSPPHGGDNRPLRYGKFGTFEGGIRVPAIVRWPARIPGARRFEEVVAIQDVMPTCLAAAGARDLDPMAGVNVLPALAAGRPIVRGDLYYAVPAQYRHRYAIRRERWKLVQTYPESGAARRDQLFDVEADPTEARDLSAEDPARARQLVAALEAWKARHPASVFAALPDRDETER